MLKFGASCTRNAMGSVVIKLQVATNCNVNDCNYIATCSKLQYLYIVISIKNAINTIVICNKNAMCYDAFSNGITMIFHCNFSWSCNRNDCNFETNCNEILDVY